MEYVTSIPIAYYSSLFTFCRIITETVNIHQTSSTPQITIEHPSIRHIHPQSRHHLPEIESIALKHPIPTDIPQENHAAPP